MMLKINPLNFSGFDRDTSKLRKVPVYNSKTDFSKKPDIFSKTKKFVPNNSKKLALGVLALAGGLVATALLLKKGKPALINLQGNKILSKAQKISDKTNSIILDAEKEYNQALILLQEAKLDNFNNVSDKNGEIIRKFTIGDKYSIMQEMSGEKIVRETNFNPENLDIRFILKNPKHVSSDCIQADKIYQYKNKTSLNYAEKVEGDIYNPDSENFKMQKGYQIRGYKLFSFIKNYFRKGEKLNTGERFLFYDGKLMRYDAKTSSDANKSKQALEFAFAKNRVYSFKKNISIEYLEKQKVESFKEEYALNNAGKLVKQNV